MPIDASQVKWDEPTAPPLEASQIQWDGPAQEQPQEQGYLAGRVEAVKNFGKALVNPETYKNIGHELANFPTTPEGKPTPEAMQQISQGAQDMALGFLPVTKLAKAAAVNKAGPDVVKEQTLKAAGEAGYSVPRSNIKQTTLTNLGERFGGKQAIEATAQQKNQPITNKLAAKAIGLSEDTPLTISALREVRQEAGKAYDVVSNLGTLSSDAAYKKALRDIKLKFSGASSDFPELASKDVAKLTAALNKPTVSAAGAVEQVKNLREAASSNLSRTSSASERLLGKAQREGADAIENLIERNIEPKLGPEILKNYRDARVLIAKTHTVQQSLNPATGNVDATILARVSKKSPNLLTGELKTIADFSQAFKRLAREPQGAPPSGGLFEPMVYGVTGGLVTGGPGAAAAAIPVIGKPIARKLMTTVPKIATKKATGSILDKPAVQKSILGTGLQTFKQQATDIKQQMDESKNNTELTNRQRRNQIEANKNDMRDLFKEASRNLELKDFRDFRKHVNGRAEEPSQKDLEFTAAKHGITVDEVKQRMKAP